MFSFTNINMKKKIVKRADQSIYPWTDSRTDGQSEEWSRVERQRYATKNGSVLSGFISALDLQRDIIIWLPKTFFTCVFNDGSSHIFSVRVTFSLVRIISFCQSIHPFETNSFVGGLRNADPDPAHVISVGAVVLLFFVTPSKSSFWSHFLVFTASPTKQLA